MKKIMLIIAVAIFGVSMANAQPGQGYGYQGYRGQGYGGPGYEGQGYEGQGRGMYAQGDCATLIPNLNDEQKSKIQDSRLKFFNEMKQKRNEMALLRAENKKLVDAPNFDQKTIDKNIDQQTAMMNSMMKSQSSHRQSIRNLLNDEQKLFFDNHSFGMGQGRGNRMGYRQNRMQENVGGRFYGNRPNCRFR